MTATGRQPVTLHHGDCRKVLPGLAGASVDAIVTDPPYELGFMGRRWDASGIAYDVSVWAGCLRVLKPGGYLLAFGGTRTYHRLACAVEDAGFEIRDSLHWLYGSGFPKGRACLKPAHEPIVLARKPAAKSAPLNIDACRVGTDTNRGDRYHGKAPGGDGFIDHAMTHGETWTAPAGRWPPNVLLTHSAACEPTGETVMVKPNGGRGALPGEKDTTVYGKFTGLQRGAGNPNPEPVAVWDCAPGCPVAELDAQSAGTRTALPSRTGSNGHLGTYEGGWNKLTSPAVTYTDTGGASRFYPVFRYQAKAPASERPRLADGTAWPTVKPLALMRWLVRLVTPPGGTVLDPFAGTGTTGEACALEGFPCILIERDPAAVELARQRLAKPAQMTLEAVL